MSEECSAAIANGLEKQKDPGCPTIPCSDGSFNFEKASCDLGASVSVMLRDVFEKLCLPMEPTGICLELGDNSIHYPLGIAEDVPVKVGHHFIPVDFVVLEIGEREKPPLILGRPFLKTVGATIDVGKGEHVRYQWRKEFLQVPLKNRGMQHDWSEGRTKAKGGAKKEEGAEKMNVKKIKEGVASVKTKEEKPPVKTKKMTKSEDKPVPKMVRKWVPKITMPAKSVDPK
jgi:hypothetical protein